MLSIRWNGSKGAVHFAVTAVKKSLTVCACTPVAISAIAHNTPVIAFMEASRSILIGERLLVFPAGRKPPHFGLRQANGVIGTSLPLPRSCATTVSPGFTDYIDHAWSVQIAGSRN